MKKLNLFFLFLSLTITISLNAQRGGINITGSVIDRGSNQPIEFATVMIADPEGKPIAGATTDLEGKFDVNVKRGDFYVEISFIGYESQRIDDFEVENGRLDLGSIVLAAEGELLDEVVVRAEKSSTEFKLDKRVFNVGKDLSSAGASALEVLNNVPSVNVSIEGDISLRGSQGVQILINGKPSVVASEGGNALSTLTAEMIDRIEVITNPSAKYDAEGTAGIINIVIKKEERKGLNGAVSVNTGTPQNHSVGLSLNRRTEKFNLFSQLGVGYRELPNDTENINTDLQTGRSVITSGEEFRNEQFYNLVLGTDYYINDRNVITLSGNFAYEVEDQPSETNFRQLAADGSTIAEWRREETTEATNPKWQYELQYKRDFKDDEKHSLLLSAIGRFFGKDQSSLFNNTSISGADRDGTQQTRTNFSEGINTFKLDYTRPLSEKITIETGAQAILNDVTNDFAVANEENGVFINDPALTNVFEFHQDVIGLYGSIAYEGEKWGLKGGLRAENTDLETLLQTTGEANNRNFTNLFPSGFISYKLTQAVSFQASYSRRIFRPRLWNLNPFFNIRNDFNIRTGNPNLLPEFTDSYEFNSIFILGDVSLNFGVYHRFTTDVVERISTFDDGVTTTQPVNLGTNAATGLELNGKYNVSKKLTFNGDLNYNYFSRDGELEGTSFDFSADQLNGKLTGRMKLPADFEIEATGQYNSSFQTVQAEVSGNVWMDLGIRKKLFKGKGALNFSVRDLFASRFRESFTVQEEFTSYDYRFRGRFITLGFSYGFGKGDTMEYTGQRRRF